MPGCIPIGILFGTLVGIVAYYWRLAMARAHICVSGFDCTQGRNPTL